MQLGMIGLGRMGGNMVRRLIRGGHQCVVFDLNPANVSGLVSEGATGASSMEDFVQKLTKPRAAWVMVPAGEATEGTVMKLAGLMEPGDTIIDGGNSYFKDDIRRSKITKERGLHYMEVGTSSGVWGIERGYCMTLGGSKESADRLDPIFKTLAPGVADIVPTPGREGKKSTAEQGYLYCGPSGAGHFVKMVHNGIEYGLMQAYEGFDIMKNATSRIVRGSSIQSRPYRHRGTVAARERSGIVVAGSHRHGTHRGSQSVAIHGYRTRFGRGALDYHGRRRGSGTVRRLVGPALHAIPFASGTHLRGENAVWNAE
jgi:6-phosphogluconate dehydrogenase (decarboxylating)